MVCSPWQLLCSLLLAALVPPLHGQLVAFTPHQWPRIEGFAQRGETMHRCPMAASSSCSSALRPIVGHEPRPPRNKLNEPHRPRRPVSCADTTFPRTANHRPETASHAPVGASGGALFQSLAPFREGPVVGQREPRTNCIGYLSSAAFRLRMD